MRFPVLLLSLVFSLSACGGGSSSDGVVFQGTLTKRGESHSAEEIAQAKHSSGQRIGEVKICILGECSITDDEGQWGVNVDKFTGGDVTVLVEGHGINSSVVTNIPDSPRDIMMDLEHSKNVISIAKLVIDGEDHTGHTHDH